MAKKTISNTFTVNTIIDGESAPYYFQEWFAWSNVTATASVTDEPTPNGGWATSIPAQGSYAYLWRKSIRYVWNESIRQYIGENAQYYRMSGTNGTSINTKGTIKVAITASGTFPTSGFSNGDLGVKQGDSYMWQFNGSSWSHVSSASSDGDSYTMTKDCTIDLDGDGTSENIKGHLIQWSTEASKWLDLGQFKGESGVTYYTHIAWATNVTISDSTVTVTGFVPDKSPNDTTHIWMGVYVDTNSGQDSANADKYTWSNTKGNKGDQGIQGEKGDKGDQGNEGKNAGEVILTPSTIFFHGDEGGYVYDTEYNSVGVGMKVDGQVCAISNISVGNTPEYVMYTQSGTTITFHNTGADYGYIEGSVSIVVTGTIASGGVTTTYIATGVLSIVCTQAGEQGERGNDAQYIYLKGSAFNKDSAETNVVNSEIRVNGGNNLAIQSRGLCLVTLNRQTLAVVDSATIYDTYVGTTGKDNLITKLNSLGNNVFVCLVSYDAIGWSDTLISLLQTFGMGDLPYTSADRYPFLFIGYKNLGKGNGITRMNDRAEPAIPVELGVYVANGALSVKDGKDGDDAPVAFANPDKITIPCGISGYVSSALTQGVTFSLKVGTNAATVTWVTSGTKPTGVTVTGQADNAVNITIATTATASGLAAGVTFTVTGTYGGKTYSATITVALIGSIKGDTGGRGKIGRFFYFGGTFDSSDSDPTHTFVVNDAQAPYFEHTETVTTQSGTTTIKRYHVFNYDTNGSYTMAQMWAISNNWNNKPWEIMTNDFKYIITEALFGAYAHFGGAIINGDFMLSQYGTINGVESTTYTSFDADHPNDNTGSNFIPYYCVNMRTGETYQNKAVVRGVINATAIYQKYQNDVEQEETVDPSKGSAVIIPNSYIGNNIYLPSASSYDYLTLTFYRYFPASTLQTIARICASGNDLIYTNTELKPTVGQYRTSCKSFYPAHNLVIKLHSIGGQWCLDCDESKLLAFYDENGNQLEVVKRE